METGPITEARIGDRFFRKFNCLNVYKNAGFRSSPNFSGYSFTPFENRPLSYEPRRPYNAFEHQRQFNHPASRYFHQRINPYTMPPTQQYQRHHEENYFVTPNAGMPENAKHCKADEHPDDRKRLENYEDFSSQDDTITVEVKTQSTVCTVRWSISSKFSKRF